ncbi:MAG: FAD-dependent oxidoreductase [Gammaproteobacteria bacterium]
MTEHYDVVVIGAGIHGAGVAQAAACRGHSVLVLERTGLATGTSSRSSKLIHGGLRYLERHDYGLVRESLRERAILLRIAPDLVHLRPFSIPVYADTSRRPLTLRAGLLLYALLGGLDRASRFRKLPRHDWEQLDGLETRGLQGVFRYYDAQTDDAELTRAVMQSASELGVVLICPAEFRSASIGPQGCEIVYRDGNCDRQCTATAMVNAAGPWVGEVAERITPEPPRIAAELVQGSHLVMQDGLAQGCYYLEAPQDRRAVFLLPWGRHSLLGTTERFYSGDPAAVTVLPEEESYLLAVLQRYFPQRSQQVVSRFAGLRVLPTSVDTAFGRSRETRLPVDNARQPRLVSVYGGKLTGYRATAQKVMCKLENTLPSRKAVADTARLRLSPA